MKIGGGDFQDLKIGTQDVHKVMLGTELIWERNSEPAVPFISHWDTTLVSTGSSADNQVMLPLASFATYNLIVDWGDGTQNTITAFDQPEVTHTYAVAGQYTIQITGDITGWRFNNGGDRLKLLEITQWGDFNPIALAFYGCENLILDNVIDIPTIGTNCGSMFYGCLSLVTINRIEEWNTSNVTNMSAMFMGATAFNGDISSWNTSSVTSMGFMFYNATSFNQDLITNGSVWDTSSVTNMSSMFSRAISFNGDISSWDTSSVTNMSGMFYADTSTTHSFNRNISSWDTSSVTNMSSMFGRANSFNQNLGNWNVSNVTDFTNFMFDKTPETFSITNLDAIYNGWSQLPSLSPSESISFGTAKYSYAGKAGRDILTNTWGWTITDGGMDWSNAFTSTWDTTLVSTGSSESNQVKLPLSSFGTYDFIIDWGDGTQDTITTYNQAEVTHTYATSGQYTIQVTGTVEGWRFNYGGDKLKLLEVTQWGDLRLGGIGQHFYGCENLVLDSVVDVLDLTSVDSLNQSFCLCKSLVTINRVSEWDISSVTSMSGLFASSTLFNGDISTWDTSNVTSMSLMFEKNTVFNVDISTWNTSSVTSMYSMFYGAEAFNGDISTWNTSSVTNMSYMFRDATAFNGDISSWNTSSVTNMNYMLQNATSFNGDISTWDTSSVTSMSNMFRNATSFNQNIGNWDVSNVIDFSSFMTSKTPETFSVENLDAIYNGWSQLPSISPNESISFGTAKYSASAQAGRDILTNTWGWTITDGGMDWSNAFISHWDTTLTSTGSSLDNQIKLPLVFSGTYNFVVDWGDGNQDTITAFDQAEVTHTYASSGQYTIQITGTIEGCGFNYGNDKLKLLEITQWGDLRLINSNGNNFDGCTNLILDNVVDILDLTGVTDLSDLFRQCDSITTINKINEWDTSNITNMNDMFYGANSFNGDISTWNTSSVTNMSGMFYGATAFNEDISLWNTSSITNMSGMFYGATSFNQDLNNWDTSNVTNMMDMFWNATSFNGNISGWNTSNVENMSSILRNVSAFNRNLGNWDVSNVTIFENFMTGKTFETYPPTYLTNIYREWSKLPSLTFGITINFGTAKYTPLGQSGRDILTNVYGWTIIDGGVDATTKFISIWNTTLTSYGSSTSNQIKLPLTSLGIYDFSIDWGDGTQNTITSFDQPEAIHTYTTSGQYTIQIEGTIEGWSFNNTGDRLKLLEITQWGDLRLGNEAWYFYGCENLLLTNVVDVLGLSNTTNLGLMFRDCISITTINRINEWDVSQATIMANMFGGTDSFNQDLNGWDVSKVTDMSYMFYSSSFNGSINSWNTSQVTTMARMFWANFTFNQPLNNWNISKVTDMSDMFYNTIFNQDISEWNTSSVINMSKLFFNSSFNQPLNNWDVSNVTDMSYMFNMNTHFNQPLNNWDTSSVTNMSNMFRRSIFNSDISTWDTSSVTNMSTMFNNTEFFNQDISNWDVSNVTNMSYMFALAESFTQDISNWNVSNVTNFSGFMWGTKYNIFSPESLDMIYNKWSQLPLKPNNHISFGERTHTINGVSDKEFIKNTFGWYVYDGGLEAQPFETIWDTRNVSTGSSASNQIRIPLQGTNSGTIDWGDGTVEPYTDATNLTHTYSTGGIYTIKFLPGSLIYMTFNNSGDILKILEIISWGSVAFDGSLNFHGCANLTCLNIKDTIDLSIVSITSCFDSCSSITEINRMNEWDMYLIYNVYSMFDGATNFNQDLSNWDTRNIWDFSILFRGTSFNHDISMWDMSSAQELRYMFAENSVFNQPIGNWSFAPNRLDYMFRNATAFNQPIDSWDVTWVYNFTGFMEGKTNTDYNLQYLGAIYDSWSQLELDSYIDIDFGTIDYPATSQPGKDILVNTFGWVITDGNAVVDPPTAATNIVASNVGTSSCTISWTEGNFTDYFSIEYSLSGGTWIEYETNITTNSLNVSGLTHNSTYEFRLISRNAGTATAISEVIIVNTLLGAISAPTNLSATNISVTSLTLTWSAGNFADYYSVERKLTSGSTWTTIQSNTTSLSQSDSGLTMETSYDYRVTAHNPGGSATSTIYTVSTIFNNITAATNLTSSSVTKTTLTLSWSAGTNLDYYSVERKLTSGSTWTVIQPNTTSLSYNVTGLTQNTSYDFRVRAHNAYGTIYSSTYTVSTLDTLFMIPSADVSKGDWTSPNPTLWETVETPGDTSNYISSSNANGSTCRLRFTTPVISGPGTLKLYRRKTTGNNPSFIWTLYRDGTQVQTNTLTLTSTTFVLNEYPLTTNLVSGATYEITLTRSGGGSPSQRGVVDMAALWIEY